ncbi:BnaA09g41880D [Brassica napus]|uniref:BnaA09g41880D protein n=1 Tax=Brassica napus TaxID=3708 RepID=A0A078I9K8_BRANA|nr:BnaA09g41880D [Brassica napus]
MVNAIILFNLFLFRNSPAKSVAETTEQQNGSKSIFNSDVHASRKRPKLEIRRGETGNASQMESDTENTHVMNGLVLWDGIVVEEKESNELSQGQDRNINESVMKKPFGFGNKSQQCIAFIESKGRQCETPMCGGVTVLGTKCKHRSLPGILYCNKHRPYADLDSSSGPFKRKQTDIMSTLEDEMPLEGSVLNETTSFTEMLEHCKASRDAGVGGFLMKLVSHAKERLSRIWGFNDESMSESIEEEKWSFSGFACAICLDSFVKRQLLEAHLQHRCVCPGLVCSPLTCDHVYLFGDDFEEARDVYGKSMRCRFPYDDEERIILEEVYPNGIRTKLEVFRTESKGWGVRACEHILRGTFVCEYIGEVLDQQEANKRRIQYGKEGCSYIHDVDANINDIGRIMGEPDYVVDATTHVNVSRCSPNLVTHQDVEESMESLLARIGLYASTDGRLFFLFSIASGEEITRDYGRKPVTSGQENEHSCHCRATNCRGHFC